MAKVGVTYLPATDRCYELQSLEARLALKLSMLLDDQNKTGRQI